MKLDQHFFQTGHSSEQAAEILKKGVSNKIDHKKEYSVFKIFLSQLTSPLIYILLFAGLVTIFMKEYVDAAVILFVVAVNTFLGFYQEKKAAKALDALKTFLKPKALVIRDGEKKTVSLHEIVPGDICLISAGQSIPADGVIVMSEDLKISEAILTGESKAVKKFSEDKELENFSDLKMVHPHEKKSNHYAYMGTTVMSGVGRLLVIKKGSKTEIGKIAHTLITLEEKPTPLQMKLANLSKFLSIIVAVGAVIILALGLLRGESFLTMLETSVAIAVSAIPEGLVVSLTVVLSLGMQKIFKQKSLVRRLLAAETLGSVTTICCDKTGTLTEGVLTVAQALGNKEYLVRASIFANDEVDEVGDALASWAKEELKKGEAWTKTDTVEKFREQCKRIENIPFSSEKKYAATLVKKGKEYHAFMIGAPELILSKSGLSDVQKKVEMARLEELAKQGYRLVAVAHRKISKKIKLTSIKNLD